jgi:hypothetical protein
MKWTHNKQDIRLPVCLPACYVSEIIEYISFMKFRIRPMESLSSKFSITLYNSNPSTIGTRGLNQLRFREVSSLVLLSYSRQFLD